MTDIEDVRLGFVGLGNIAHLHADQVLDVGGTVAAGTDIDEDAREEFAAAYDADVYEDEGAMYEYVDAVVVSTPNTFHEEYVTSALEAGLSVLVEKPLAHSLESAERIADVAADAEGFCMVGFHNRFRGPVQVLDQYRRDGELGDVSHVEANYIRRRGVPGRGSWFTRKEVSGGGAVIDIGTHAIDVALHLLGFPEIEEVSAQTRAQFGPDDDYTYLNMWGYDEGAGGFDVDDSATAFVRCANGTTISLEVAWASNRYPSQELVVRGDGGGAHLDMADDSLTVLDTADDGAAHHRDTEIETADQEAHGLEQEYFLEHVASGDTPEMNTIEQGLTVQRVMDAIYRSSEAGKAVSVE
ncbi:MULTISPECIES: Gfo/Idh/MocA family protein [Halomicrobium]|uniref:Oxidoreductase domain protein n=2 Tax=Halomicrobium mukohataei TaxID=57705 RepID=C7NXE7_HALMD|nr:MULTISPECIES: Gfo/Idh/MocA family oxidoreductase [Halomicrobium]ACV48381.1 oxidoreductase domain protein [Halomicrobium mukohataei DSM 12286]QCD66792.1 Gfo/Idh/MocA family oxidoreductase [Halomicrobium mukohataei]QFR21601.1 gfo/Idh/MocA family oxidoreductase [Halomicrobium sp. ZPS1]